MKVGSWFTASQAFKLLGKDVFLEINVGTYKI